MGSKLYFAVFELLSLLSYSVSPKTWKLEKMLFCNCLDLRFFMYYERNWASSDYSFIYNSSVCFARIYSLGAKYVEKGGCILPCSIYYFRLCEYFNPVCSFGFFSNSLCIFHGIFFLEYCYGWFDGCLLISMVCFLCEENRSSTIKSNGLLGCFSWSVVSVCRCVDIAGFDIEEERKLFVNEKAFCDECCSVMFSLFCWSALAGADEK